MTYTNNLKKTVDMPVWELTNQAPVATSSLSALTTTEDGSSRYLFYFGSSALYRYDTVGDVWQQLATPNVVAVNVMAARMTMNRGYHGRVISATTSTVTFAGLRRNTFNGKKMQILQGTGLGQEKTLTFVSENVLEYGVANTGTGTTSLGDTTKKWKVNQWAGYMFGITYGTDQTQYKKVLYNDTTTCYFQDSNLQPQEPWNNQQFQANAPYTLPVASGAAQTHYTIFSHTYSVDTNWTTTPDNTSFFTTLTGGIYMMTSANGVPFVSLQYYDIIHDQWQTKTLGQSHILAAFGTDMAIERTGKFGDVFLSGTATSGASRTLTDTLLALTPNRYRNYRILITGGTGIGQNRRIICHTATSITVSKLWDINPDATSTYEIWGDYDQIYIGGNAGSSMFSYSPQNDYLVQGLPYDDGVVNNISVRMNGWQPFGVSTGTRILAGIQAISSTPTAGGTNYVVGDILTCAVGGTGAQVIVTSVGASGAVTAIQLVNAGATTGYTVGTGKATTGGTGSGCTINITTAGPTAKIVLATAHLMCTGNSVIIAGCTEALYNTTTTIIGVNSTTTFDIATTATANMVASNSQSTTVIVDSSKNWTVNEHVGKIVDLLVAGTSPTSQKRWITANTATTLTVATIVAGVNGTSKYVISESKLYGADTQYKLPTQSRDGFATGGTTTTLVDSTKNWNNNQWAGYKLRVEAGTGFGSGIISIVSNTATTLTYALQTFTPDATSFYEIADTWGLATASSTTTITETTTKNWATNQWVGKRMKICAGTGLGQELSITANTATVLTFGVATTGDATSVYCLLGIPVRGAGLGLIWLWGTSDSASKGKCMLSPRGGASNTFDIYDITTTQWDYGTFFSPQQETFTIGSMYAYDGADTVYLHKDNTGRIFKINMVTGVQEGAYQLTDLHSTALIGNRMELIESSDGVPFLYVMQHTGTKMYRTLIF